LPLWSQRLLRLLLPQRPLWRLQRLRERFRWLQWLLRWRRWQPLWLVQLWSLLWLPLPGLQLALSPLLSVEPVLQVCPKPVPLLPIHFARRWLLLLPCLPLQRLPLRPLPVRPLCRLLWSRYSLLLWLLRWQQLLLPQLPSLQQPHLQALFRWLLSQLRWPHSPPLSLQSLWWLLPLPLPELRLVLFQLLSVAPVLQVCPKRLLLLPIHFARHWLLPLPLLPLQQPLLLLLPDRLFCRLSSLHLLLPLQ
jgi:hypothetical protein